MAKRWMAALALVSLGALVASRSDAVLDALGRVAATNETVPVPLPHHLEVFGEPVPLSESDIAECLSRELHANTYWHSNTLLMLQRRPRWEARVRTWLREEGVPGDFVYLLAAESGFQPTAFSPSGAAGLWQFMPATAKEHGLRVDGQIDERYHAEKSTRAAAKYLKRAKEQTGSWFLAAAAYNMGLTGVLRQMDRQGERDYFRMTWNEETGRYAFRIAAMKLILEHPEHYGFQVRAEELWREEPGRRVAIDSSVAHWGRWAQREGTYYRELKRRNPWLRESYFENPDSARIELELPEKR
ncbi:MAG: lytic transglycosylase domain-containing protein [Schleiferiaceae bacterium]